MTRIFLAVIAITLLVASMGWSQSGVVTWINWSQEPGIAQVVSGYSGVKATVTSASDNKAINTVDELASAGWSVENGCIVTPQRSGGNKIVIHVAGLPAGTQDVYVRLHTGPRSPGNEWWYSTPIELEGQPAGEDFRLISGLGGYDRSSMYEVRPGTVGTPEKPVSEITLSIRRYEWTQFSRIGSIRIETEPSMTASSTSIRSPENDAVRAELAKGAVKDASGNIAYCLRTVSGSATVRPKSFDSLRGLALSSSIDIYGARGEYENKQVLIFSDTQGLSGVEVRASELKASDGSVIPADSITAAPLGYVKYSTPYDLDRHGYWPDPILPFLKSFDVARDDVQSVWYRVFVPRDAIPGDYTGKLSIIPSNAPAFDVPVNVRVWGFEVPKMSHLRVVTGCNASGDIEYNRIFEMSYKINPSSIYGFSPDFRDRFPEWAKAGVTAINLAYFKDKSPSQDQLDRLCDDFDTSLKALEAVGLRDKAYFYMFDEATAEYWPAVRMVCDAVKARFPDLKIMTTAHDGVELGADGRASDKETGRWTGIHSGLEKIDIWVPMIFHYDIEQAAQARKLGRQVWWYTCNSPDKPYPGVLIHHTAMDTRLLMGFMAFAYGTDGFLYYATQSRGGSWRFNTITTGPYTDWPIIDTGHEHLYQKGPDDKALPSRRMEMLRDGLEDYDYLWIARELAQNPKVKASKDPDLVSGIRLLEKFSAPGNELVRNMTDYTQDPSELEQSRKRIGDFIEKAGKK